MGTVPSYIVITNHLFAVLLRQEGIGNMVDFSAKRIYSHYNWQLFLCSGLLTLSSTNFGALDTS